MLKVYISAVPSIPLCGKTIHCQATEKNLGRSTKRINFRSFSKMNILKAAYGKVVNHLKPQA